MPPQRNRRSQSRASCFAGCSDTSTHSDTKQNELQLGTGPTSATVHAGSDRSECRLSPKTLRLLGLQMLGCIRRITPFEDVVISVTHPLCASRYILGHDVIVDHQHLPKVAAWGKLPVGCQISQTARAMLPQQIQMCHFRETRCIQMGSVVCKPRTSVSPSMGPFAAINR